MCGRLLALALAASRHRMRGDTCRTPCKTRPGPQAAPREVSSCHRGPDSGTTCSSRPARVFSCAWRKEVSMHACMAARSCGYHTHRKPAPAPPAPHTLQLLLSRDQPRAFFADSGFANSLVSFQTPHNARQQNRLQTRIAQFMTSKPESLESTHTSSPPQTARKTSNSYGWTHNTAA